MRPMYEDNETLAAESKLIKFLEGKWNAQAAKLPIAYNVDYGMFVNNELKCWLEVKCRYCTKDQYDTYFISSKKIVNGITLSEATGKPFILAVEWKDKTGWMEIKRDNFDIRIGGRSDRNDWQDIEPMAHFKTQDFVLLNRE